MLNFDGKLVLLCGGVGGARAALALYENFPRDRLTFIVNTGDDFRHMGLQIWPDWDTVCYHLAEVADRSRGWGRADEGTRVMSELKRFGAPTWFHLGDRDVALHLHRTWRLQEGASSSEVAGELTRQFGIASTLLPVTDQSLRTKLRLKDGRLVDFQDWFVGEKCGPEVEAVVNEGAGDLALAEGVEQAIADCTHLIFAPSNPYLSLNTMLGHPRFAEAVRQSPSLKLAVSPLIEGKALKGPLDSLIQSLSSFQGQEAIAQFWMGWVDGLLLPAEEVSHIRSTKLQLLAAPTLLKQKDDRKNFAGSLFHHLRRLKA